MKINTEIILALEPCENRKENYLKFYKDFDGSLEDFFKLDKIFFSDKIWVAIKLVDKNTRVKFAVKCAEFVLPIFEEKFSDDKRIRNCIEFLNSIDDFDHLNDDQLQLLRFHKNSASDAASDANFASATVAAYVAAYAANAANAAVASASAAAIAAATSAAKLNHNTLQNHSTIFQFLLDLINEKKEINNELYKL